ncbi:NrsF family protein [Sphingomicrobium clamense]|uniref:DUF1109 domain-containing protein n=1 Tax=Sphingomicrobium clamense TaxID=2851013 RepID=A0ABS6V5U2_9SPHN|nr:DUF1109 domain-containing protein [Sphingomicrobium sp. B8]MBW0144725.1 DUF1109 domain-containing protein [Sphingomicrobium sp. B8]
MTNLIDTLADDLEPTSILSLTRGRIAAASVALATTIGVVALYGIRPDLAAGRPAPLILVTAGLFLLTAIAAGWAATRLARPAVGSANQTGALWLFGAILILPAVSAIELALGHGVGINAEFGARCLTFGLIGSIFTASAITLFLRRGAPVLPEKAGLLTGLAAGSVGAFAVTLECSGTALAHLAIWHVGIVALWAAIGRWGVSRLLRW